jgi:competence protein ComEC
MVLFGWVAPLAESFAAVNALLLRAILEIANFSGTLSWSYVETLRFTPVHAVPFYLALLWFFHASARRRSRVFFVLLVCSLMMVLVVPEARVDVLPADRLRVSFIDVGQGDAALIEFPGGRSMLIDAGMWSEEFDAGRQIVVPFLKRRGITTLDWFVASHPHADHIGGAASVFESLNVHAVLESGHAVQDPVYLRYRQAMETEQSSVLNASQFDTALVMNGAKVYVLYPQVDKPAGDSSMLYTNLNNISVVVRLVFGETSFLFVGDLEREGEAELVRLFGKFLGSDVLKVGHHGSNTSSTPDLLECVQPRYAVISVGRNNKFRHPSEEVIERLQTLGAEVLRTDEEGAIVFETDGKTLERIMWR